MLDYDTPATVSQHFYNGIMILLTFTLKTAQYGL